MPEITFPAPGEMPPMTVALAEIALMPVALLIALVPVTSVPIRLP